jgi:hypothetical protein
MRTIIVGIMSMLLDTNTIGIGHIMNTQLTTFTNFASKSKDYNKDIIKKLNLIF